VAAPEDEDALLRSVALQNASTILLARQRAEEELLRTQEALRQSQERLTAALSAAGTGTFRWVIGSSEVEGDGNFAWLFGLDTDASTQPLDSVIRAVHPEDRDRVAAALDRSAREGTDFDLEFRVVRPDGSVHWIHDKARAFAGDGGKPAYMAGACTEITSRKEAEAALEEETRSLELLNETGQTLASELDLETVVQAVTDAGTAMAGAEFGAFFYNIVGKDGEAFLLFTLTGAPREAFERFGNPRATALLGPTFRGESPIRCDDVLVDPRYGTMGPHHGMPKGHLPVRSYLAVPVRSRSGEVIGGLFFGHSRTGVFTARSERLIVGLAAQAGIAIDNARLYEAAQAASEERRALLESERAARSEAERMSRMKDEFLATLSHELRTPLNAILGWAQVLRTGAKDGADLVKGLETIERNARAQTQLIEDLLDMSRITSGMLRLDVQPTVPAAFVEAAIESVTPAAEAKGIRLERILDWSAGPISGDAGRLQQVAWNLLSNAIKFTPRHGKVQVVVARVNSHIEISVADTGIGIREEFVPHLFERFRQVDASTTRGHGGLGLGLSIVKNLVELHGGTISVTSRGEGQGTTATVSLPLMVARHPQPAERLHPATPTDSGSFTRAELAGITVLVVDDQADARDLMRRLLEACSATVLTAAGADEALRLVREDRPDVFVSDIGMPQTDGFELLRRVRALGPEQGGRVPAIALTAFARSEDRIRALRAGFVVHVAKPVDPSELVATVASVAGRLRDG
jgi:signal transduction histidine kinase/ActR/RegA family two-component response regulator